MCSNEYVFRITTNQEKFTAKQQLRNSYERKYIKSRQKNSQEYKEELLSNKVDFIKSSTNYKCTNVSVSNDIHKQDRGNLISKRKKPKGGTHENDFKQKDHPQTQEGVDHSIQIDTESDSSVLCLSGDNSVITIDSDDTEASKDKINNIEHLKKRRKLLKKKRKKLEEHLNSYKSKKNSKTHKKKSKDKC